MKSWFLKREYPEKLIENEMRKVRFCKEGIKKAKGVKGIPFVVTYHPQLKNLGRIINQNIYLLNMNEETKKVFSPRPMVSFRSPRKISSYHVRGNLYPLDRVVGSTKCFCDLFIFIAYGFLGVSLGSSVLVELYVDDMQFYQQ